MPDPYHVIRELARKALLTSKGDWTAAEELCHRWLEGTPASKQQLMEGMLEFFIRHAISTEGRRQQQYEAIRRREALLEETQQQETAQAVEDFLQELWRKVDEEAEGPGDDAPSR